MRKEQVLNCMFSKWYPTFKSVTVRSRVIDLSDDVVKYLLADGIVLPRGEADGMNAQSYCISDDDVDKVDWDTDVKTLEGPNFDQLNAKIRDYISQLGGSVIPKLNWSAPRDCAPWMSFDRTLRCTCPADIYLLLKSSDFVSHDLTNPFEYCDDADSPTGQLTYQLVLRKWLSIAPQDEFRCFVINQYLIGISQRNHSVYFPSLKTDRKNIANDIQSFFCAHVQNRFPNDDYVFDVYRKADGEVILLDFNPFGLVTDGLLFEWDELFQLQRSSASGNATKLDFRLVESESGIKPNPYSCYAVPQDFVHLTCGLDPAKFEDLLNLRTQMNEDSSDGEEEQEQEEHEQE